MLHFEMVPKLLGTVCLSGSMALVENQIEVRAVRTEAVGRT